MELHKNTRTCLGQSHAADPTDPGRHLRDRRRQTGPHIASRVGSSPVTVARVLAREGLSRLVNLDPKPPVRRYQRDHPGELIHIDTKTLGRIQVFGHRITGNRRQCAPGAGLEFGHVVVGDASRLAYAEVRLREQRPEN